MNTNRHINEVIELLKRKLLANQLSKESKMVAGNSMEVLAEFESLIDEDQGI